MQRLMIVAVLALLLEFGVGRGQEPSLDAALVEAEARWQARRPKAYEFSIEIRCFCFDLAKRPPRFAVVEGVPRSMQVLEPRTQHLYEYYNTVEKLFAAIRRSLSSGRYKIAVQYEKDLGYPVMADLDPRRDVADEELVLKVINFRPIASSTAQPNRPLQPTSAKKFKVE